MELRANSFFAGLASRLGHRRVPHAGVPEIVTRPYPRREDCGLLMGVLRISGAGYLHQRHICLGEDFSSLQSRVREVRRPTISGTPT